ncbi:Sialin [Pseudolycoriella hygida]|uniref:Sialin n=1 Tax=Pseudolycoriella hygida TaxID=35572 RepID=A0A9Q0S5M9_9DIPT|nr:Sialin [Pseudolycoriella hygida]
MSKVQQRYVLTVALFFGITIAIAERSVMSMAITRMVEIPNLNVTSSSKEDKAICEAPHWAVNTSSGTTITDQAQQGVKYSWTQEQQGMILSSFFVGYILTQVPGGLLAQNFGGKYVLGLGITTSALCSISVPLAAQYGGLYGIIVLRILMGASQGPMFPALIQLLAIWIPPTERSFITSFVYSGTNIGTVIASYFSGIIMHHHSWEWVFYIFGTLAIVWFCVFCVFCFDSPSHHPYISTAERNYLLQELGQLRRHENQSTTPWRDMFTSKPVWALIIAKICGDFAYFVDNTTLPKYMNDVLHLSIRDVGAFNALPWILKTIVSFAFGYTLDRMVSKQKIRITTARKLAVFLASVFPGTFIILASYAGCEHVLVVVFFTTAITMHGFLAAGLSANSMDLSPNYSGVLISIANGAASMAGIFAPYVIGVMTPNAYLSQWRLVFWLTFVILCLKTTFFTIWGSGNVQPWNVNKNSPLIDNSPDEIK